MEALAALVISLATLVTAVGALIMAFINANKINEVHVSINSRMDQLLKSHGLEMKAQGIAEERANPR